MWWKISKKEGRKMMETESQAKSQDSTQEILDVSVGFLGTLSIVMFVIGILFDSSRDFYVPFTILGLSSLSIAMMLWIVKFISKDYEESGDMWDGN